PTPPPPHLPSFPTRRSSDLACGWKSGCPHCSAYRVFHKLDRTLRCHHCGFTQRVLRACPDCGNLDIEPVGRGTEQVEEQLAGLLDRKSTRLNSSHVKISYAV